MIRSYHAMCFLSDETVDLWCLASQSENLLNHQELILFPKANQMQVLFWELTSGSYSGMKTSWRGFKIPDRMPFLETKINGDYSSTPLGMESY